MAMPMTSRLFEQPSYAYTIVTPPADEVCMICLEPYAKEQAIRLTHCGHLIGSDCFRDWTSYHPETCTYWNDPLPVCDPPEPSMLEQFCGNRESEYLDSMKYFWPAGRVHLLSSLRALWDDQFTFINAAEFMYVQGAIILQTSVIIAGGAMFLFAFAMISAFIFFMSLKIGPITLIRTNIVATMKTTDPSIGLWINAQIVPLVVAIPRTLLRILVIISLVFAVLLGSMWSKCASGRLRKIRAKM
jgi:hypothetical protein